MNIEQLKEESKRLIFENRDINKIDKIIKGLETGKITKDNFYDNIRKFTKNTYSDHSIGRWQCISEWFYNRI